MPGRQMDPRNVVLADQISALLCDVWPEVLTSREVADRVGGTRTMWDTCRGPRTCRAVQQSLYYSAEMTHHPGGPGQADQDSWELPIGPQHVNPVLNRLMREGKVSKGDERSHGTARVVWTWTGDAASDDPLAEPQARDEPTPASAERERLVEQRRQVDDERRAVAAERRQVASERAALEAERDRLRAEMTRQRAVTAALLAASECRSKAAKHDSEANRHLLNAIRAAADIPPLDEPAKR